MSTVMRKVLVGLSISALALASCSSTSSNSAGGNSASKVTSPAPANSASGTTSSAANSATPAAGGAVVLVTHDSFNLTEKALADMQQATGVTVTVLPSGDAGSMVNKLVLTKSNPMGDAVFGIDNTFASRALKENVIANAGITALPGAPTEGVDPALVPVDFGDVCVNIDKAYFANKKIAPPVTLDDLTKPEYQNLFVTPSPATSSPGLAFLMATVAAYGADGYQDYWRKLKANGTKVTAGWTDAYTVDFSASAGKGDRPIVLSYASSPAFEVNEAKTESKTAALLDTCFRQVEYAGVLTGAKNPEGAKKVVEYLLTEKFQAGIPDMMYMYPANKSVTLDPVWQSFAPVATAPKHLAPQEIATNREKWVAAWSEVMEG